MKGVATSKLPADERQRGRLAAMKAEGRHRLPRQRGFWIDDAETLKRIEELATRLNLSKHLVVKLALSQFEVGLANTHVQPPVAKAVGRSWDAEPDA